MGHKSVAGKIFINYRRDDAPDSAGFLDYLLEQEFSRDIVFKEVDSIKLGDDFEATLIAEVANCDIFLAVIGPQWRHHMDACTDNPKDFVRTEIRVALQQDKRVIPILVQDADMPDAADLPEDIRPLATRNAIRLRPECFTGDTQGLISGLHIAFAELKAERQRTEDEKATAEEERRQRALEEAERLAQAEERVKQATTASLSPQEVSKAEELANWDFIKERKDEQELRDHLARFPDSTTTLYARTSLEDLIWTKLSSQPSIEDLQDYLKEFPQAVNSEKACSQLAHLKRQADKAHKAEKRQLYKAIAWSAQQRGIVMGALATAAAIAVIAAGRWAYQGWLWQTTLVDPSLQVVDFSSSNIKPGTGQSFKECDTCPEMVVIPAGQFVMGSPKSESGRNIDTEDQINVTIGKSFAICERPPAKSRWLPITAKSRIGPPFGGLGARNKLGLLTPPCRKIRRNKRSITKKLSS